ncbi:uncharacterized protein [Anabrus simplex]|uniref:uncharacterized protein n=1 Tax=Anabrus simplex TaxID=316456 RepID=UPI0035A2B26F
MKEENQSISQEQPRTPTPKRPRAIHRDGRRIIAQIAECCDLEKEKKQLLVPLNKSIERVAAYTGKSVATIKRIRAFSASHPGECPSTPGKKRERTQGKIKLNDFDKRVVRDTIEDFYAVQKVVPTVNKLIPVLEKEIKWKWSSTSLRKVLKNMGFVWKKVQNNHVLLLERADIVDCRARFLVKIKRAREEGKEVFYLDESWVDNKMTTGKCWQGENDVVGVTAWGISSIRLIIASVGSEKGFIGEAQLIFEVRNTQGEYYGHMNSHNFEKWFGTSVLPNLPPASVIVMNSAPYHSRQVDEVPSRYDTRVTMVQWLRRRGIFCDVNQRKEALYRLVEENRPPNKIYAVDVMAAENGHVVLRLPPHNSDLNAIELAWAKLKHEFEQHSITGGMSATNLGQLSIEAFRSVSAADWEGYCRKVKELEEEYWRHDNVMEIAMDEIVIDSIAYSSDDCESDISENSSWEQ